MSLKFLAVGRTIAGMRDEKSPFALRKGNQLPSFPSAPRFAGKVAAPEPGPFQTDWLQPAGNDSPVAARVEAVPHASPFQNPAPVIIPAKRRRGWWSFLGWKWFRASKPRTDLVQGELSIEKVRVLRNDLADSDLELVLKRKKKKAQPVFVATQQNNNLPRHGWTELAAKLFELGQK